MVDPSYARDSLDQIRATAEEENSNRDFTSPAPSSVPNTSSTVPDYTLASSPAPPGPTMGNHPYFGNITKDDLEEKALNLAVEEEFEESGRKWRPWAANARSIRVGEIVLIVDSDTIVPEDCLRDAAREMRECEDVGIIQHESGMRPPLGISLIHVSDNIFRRPTGRAPLL